MSNKPYKQKPNSGMLIKNTNRKTDKHPEYWGNANIEGKDFGISAWVNTSKKGNKYFNLSFTVKKPVYNESQKLPKKEEPYNPEFTDDIPF
jgi:uncharacterized protein (DUF736 family)